MKKNNINGSILIATTVLYLLIALSMSFVLFNVSEMNAARRYYHSTAAFWLAEAGIHMFIKNSDMLNDSFSKTIPYEDGTINLLRDDSKSMFRLITATGIFGGVQRKIQIAYPVNIPEVYKNTLSSKGNITITGRKSSVIVNGKTRLTGQLINNANYGRSIFQDLKSDQDNSLTSLSYFTGNSNNESNNFHYFMQNNKDLIAGYPEDTVLYIKTNGTYTLPNDGSLTGKKIIYIEGDSGGGNVLIQSHGAVAQNQNLTIISTGTVTFNQSGHQAPNSQLNIISWGGYNESVSSSSSHRGLIYTHGEATFNNINADSINYGGIIADGGMTFGEVWSTKIFNYADMTTGGYYPSGFEKLIGGSITTVAPYPTSWREVTN